MKKGESCDKYNFIIGQQWKGSKEVNIQNQAIFSFNIKQQFLTKQWQS